MIITKADIGRKAVSRDGMVWRIVSVDAVNASARNALVGEYYFDHNGDFSRFNYDIPNSFDLIRWTGETEDSR
jgi:hypothetical protein